MACFLAPTAVAIAVSSIRKKVPAKYHIDWLIFMLWGGVVMFAIEHIIKGEIIFYPPFLTAMKDSASFYAMLKEIVQIGVPMTIAVFMVWILLVLIVNNLHKILKIRKDKIKIIKT